MVFKTHIAATNISLLSVSSGVQASDLRSCHDESTLSLVDMAPLNPASMEADVLKK